MNLIPLTVDARAIRRYLRRRARRAGQAQLARDLRVSPQYLSDILAKRRMPGPKILRALDLRALAVYAGPGAEAIAGGAP